MLKTLMALPLILSLMLTSCGSGGRTDDYPEIPDGIPVIAGGFVNWTDVQTTPDGSIGIVNGTGNAIVEVTFTDATGDETFTTFIAPGAVWPSGIHPLPGMYLVSAIGSDGREFRRYHRYAPDIGWEAAVISNANFDIGF